MKGVNKGSGWRSLVGMLGVAALALGLSLKLEGAPTPIRTGAADKTGAADGTQAVTATKVESLSAIKSAPAHSASRVKAGSIPDGLPILATVYGELVDAEDEGARLRQAGALGGVATGGDCDLILCTGKCTPPLVAGVNCSFNVHCDDGDPCTADRCDFITGSAICSGRCVHDPVRDNFAGGCDNGNFCDGKETCQGAVCLTGSERNELLSCGRHEDCGLPGTCNFTTSLCTVGNVGATCAKHADCDIRGTCGGGDNDPPCDSDADCAPGVCTFRGTCAGAACTDGIPAICCSEPPDITVCSEKSSRCSAESLNAGVVCRTTSDCKNGICERCQPSCENDAQCSDGRRCNGDQSIAGTGETCLRTCAGGDNNGKLCPAGNSDCPGGTCVGQCQPGINPCGVGAHCEEKRCEQAEGAVSPPFDDCLFDSDCPPGRVCRDIPTSGVGSDPDRIKCFLGRCCTTAINPVCSKAKLKDCTTASGVWFASDTGEHSVSLPPTGDVCGGSDPEDLTNDPWGCPKASSGFTQLGRGTPPIYPVTVGPVSDSRACTPAPGGIGGACADPFDPAGRFRQLGDDYEFTNGSYMGLDVVRFVLDVATTSRLSMDIYDESGNLAGLKNVLFQQDVPAGRGVVILILRDPLVIPPKGWITLRTSERFIPNSKFSWLSTTATSGGAGINHPNALWINGYPGLPAASVSNNFLKMCDAGPRKNQACVDASDCPNGACGTAPGILAFELAGDKVAPPVGACCKSSGPSASTCQDGVVSWECTSQRSCSNSPATTCTTDAQCSGGTCLPNVYHGDGTLCKRCNGGDNAGLSCTDNNDCPSTGGFGTCSTGQVGEQCSPLGGPPHADCDEVGVCDLFTQTCANPHATGACTVDSQCDVAGTCVEVSCEAIAACTRGACCNTSPAVCNPEDSGTCCSLAASSGACSGAWQGYGTDCDADNGHDPAKQHGCKIPYYPETRCMSGPNNLQVCNNDGDCRKCMGGSRNGLDCSTTSDATTGCLDVGTCDTSVCVGGLTPGASCTTNTDCPNNSGLCRGRCIPRGTGGDNCMDAYVHVITVPTLQEGPKTVSISGTNIDASSSDDEPENCSFNGTDPMWWEAFSIDKCARVRLDFCESVPVREPSWVAIVGTCNSDGSCDDFIVSGIDPFTPGQRPSARGAPYCADNNGWGTYGTTGNLPPGTYWRSVYSDLAGTHGPYQMHVTVQACPTAACCFLACSVSGAPCNPNSPCAEGTGPCETQCEELVKDDCDARLGYSLAAPNVYPAQPLCIGESTCEFGSCCTGPGICKDSRDNAGNPVNQALCEDENFHGGGTFVGGVLCKGGRCASGPDTGLSCNTITDCAGNAPCNGTALQLAQSNPCPVCTIEGSSNCQRYDLNDQISPSDLSAGSGTKWADDFRLTGPGVLNSVCVTGGYVETDLSTTTTDCGGPVEPESQRADNFRVRIYEDLDGRPGALKAERAASRTKARLGTRTFLGGSNVWTFQLSFEDITFDGADALQCWWLEVVNDTGTSPALCVWHWAQLAESSTQANLYSASGSETTGYDAASQRAWDMAWCINLDVVAGACASVEKPCCSCQGACTAQLLNDCDDADSSWQESAASCTGACVPPANDICANAEEVPVGLYSVTTHCADTDGGNPVHFPVGGAFSMQRDVWYYFRPANDCPLSANTCTSSQLIFDSALAIYYDTENPTQCPCPLTEADGIRTLADGSDDECVVNGVATGGVVNVNAFAGHCYTIRVAGFPGADEGGRAAVDISCGAPFCGDERKNGSEQCDGLDNEDCRTANPSTLCNPDCTCGATNPCGNGVVDSGEECDPNGGTPCASESTCRQAGDPLQCTCTSFCGNDRIERGEECDGTDDDACPGRCRSSEVPPVCLCPPLVCGNGRLEELAGEECEFGLCDGGNNDGQPCEDDSQCEAPGTCDLTADRGDCASGACRPLNDPLGGCRCGCEGGVIVNSIVWDPATNPTPWPNNNPEAATRSLMFRVVEPEPGPSKLDAIKVTMVDLQNPIPANEPAFPPPNFSAFESATCTAEGATGSQGSCARWAGRPSTFYEAQGPPLSGPYRAARLQCAPFYWDWKSEGLIVLVGAEIVPSSEYSVRAYAATCMGAETGCADVSAPVTMYTRRSGDVAEPYRPGSEPPTTQPNAIDIAQVVNHFRRLVGAPVKARAQVQPNLPELNADVSALDIAAVVDGVRLFAYSPTGPCPCPSTVTCGGACGVGACAPAAPGGPGICVKTCVGGDNDGQPCINNNHCPGGGACGATGTCRDRCGRCN